MFIKSITAAALAIGMSTAAFAQTPGGGGEAMDPAVPGAGTPSAWDQTTTDAFFSDPAAGPLRSQDEIQANWGTLSPQQQAEVRSHCATVAAAPGAAPTTTGDAGTTIGDADTTTGDLGTTTGDAGTTTGDAGTTTGDASMTDDTMTGSTTDEAVNAAPGADADRLMLGEHAAATAEICSWVQTH